MKKLNIAALTIVTLILPLPSMGSQTLDLEDEYREGNGKICVYSNGRTTETVYKGGAGSCPSKHIKRG